MVTRIESGDNAYRFLFGINSLPVQYDIAPGKGFPVPALRLLKDQTKWQ